MIEISLGQLRAPAFSQACGKIMNTPGLEPKVAYHVMRTVKLFEQELKLANEAFKKLVNEWAVLVEGKPDNFQVPPEKLEEWNKVVTNFHEAKIKVDKYRWKLSDLEKAQLTPADYMAIEPLITGFELIEGSLEHGKEKSN
jgi:hypothetical protein